MSTPVPIHGWGRYPVVEAPVIAGEDLARITEGAVLSRGLGRAYGDAALPAGGAVAVTTHADRILSFDRQSGLLRAEAGLSLRQLMRSFLPLGWFTPVSPGTQYVTLGGMVASDIHGKNHHVHGTISNYVERLLMRVASGDIVACSRTEHPDLFWATCGGMGLTGHILEVDLRLEKLERPWIYEETQRFPTLEETFSNLNAASEQWPMTVCWVDTSARGKPMGRGILNRGRWATADEAQEAPPTWRGSLEVPPVFPSFTMNALSIKTLNTLYYVRHPNKTVQHVVSPEAFYYILDLVTEWNRGYGAAGFTQYQCVMPSELSVARDFLERFQKLGGCSFVTVFKDCGAEGEGLLSFPQRGTSLALDIPLGAHIPELVRELNAFIIDHGGRVYLAKDAFTTADEFARMYPRLDAFREVKAKWDPNNRITSVQGKRLGLC